MTTTSVKLDHEMEDRLQRLASARRGSADRLMREPVEQYLQREEQRHAMQQDALSAWEEFERTGLHVTEEDADKWLSKLEAGEDARRPHAKADLVACRPFRRRPPSRFLVPTNRQAAKRVVSEYFYMRSYGKPGRCAFIPCADC